MALNDTELEYVKAVCVPLLSRRMIMIVSGDISLKMKNHCPYVQLQDGYQVPMVGFGTSQAMNDVAEAAVSCALDAGYRLIDTAAFYDNEAAIGRALHQKCLTTNLRREDVFVTSKLPSRGLCGVPMMALNALY
ncbi:unnamed protein product [Dibothriocephalus latus]|uniref:NADP-dependent oxidoreductase domain-containing protein n=1 Tax=Dibothriocephalus latus TaxID=60516 RepID=A0A3P7MH57_DIBLA|nr:unnamed protein product [Dibothriocephalus latus]